MEYHSARKLASSGIANSEDREADSFLNHFPLTGFTVPPREGGAMLDRIEFARPSHFRQIIFLVILVASVCSSQAGAQKKPSASPGPKYDLQAEAKIKGVVDDVKLPPKGSEKEIVHLTVKDGSDSVDVYLCPKTFLDDMGMSFAKGDAVAMTGSKAKQNDADVFLVREIVKGNDSFVLRDAKGEPVWDWRH
jgi:hypothetical protein